MFIKRIIAVSGIIIGFILVASIAIHLYKASNSVSFPHFKQALVKMNGTVYVEQGNTTDVPFVFVDSRKVSEMSSAENIKSVKLIFSGNKAYQMKKWTIYEGDSEDTYTMRNLQMQVVLPDVGQYQLESISIEYKDSLVKKFDVGDVKFIVKSQEAFKSQYIMIMNYNTINKIRPSLIDMSGLSVYAESLSDDYTIEDIDLGIDGFGIDNSKIHVILNSSDINRITEARNANEKWVSVFDDMQPAVNGENKLTPIQIKKANFKTTELDLPIYCVDQKKYLGQILFLSVHMDVISDGVKKEVYSINPVMRSPKIGTELDPVKLLSEAGK